MIDPNVGQVAGVIAPLGDRFVEHRPARNHGGGIGLGRLQESREVSQVVLAVGIDLHRMGVALVPGSGKPGFTALPLPRFVSWRIACTQG